MITTILLFVFLVIDGVLSRVEGFIFVGALMIYLLYLIKINTKIGQEDELQNNMELVGKLSYQVFLYIFLSVVSDFG